MAKFQQQEGAAVLDAPAGHEAADKETRAKLWLVRMLPAEGMSLAEYELWSRVIAAPNKYEACERFKEHYSILSTIHRLEAVAATAGQLAVQKDFDSRSHGTRGKRTELEAAFAKAADPV